MGLGLSGAALAGLIYFEGMSARAEGDGDEDRAEDAAELEAEAVDELDEPGEVDALADPADEPENIVREVKPVAAAPSGAGQGAMAGSPIATPSPATDGRLAMATLAAADSTSALPAMPPLPALVAVPDIEGMSLRKAKKQLAAVGLKLAVRDEYGEKIPREYWSEYKVRKQKLDAGTEVQAGSTVKVKARVRMRYAQGY